MSRHSRALQELAKRIQDGALGEIVLLRGYRMHGPGGLALPKPAGTSELMYQIRKFHGFLWASGGYYSDFYIHVIDHLCWMKDAWPVKAQAVGGGLPTAEDYIDQNFDTYSVEYTYADGPSCSSKAAAFPAATGITRASCTAPRARRSPPRRGTCRRNPHLQGAVDRPQTRSGRSSNRRTRSLPERMERPDDAIRKDKPYNEVKRGRRGEPRHLDGPHGRPHRPGDHLRRHAQLQARVRPGSR